MKRRLLYIYTCIICLGLSLGVSASPKHLLIFQKTGKIESIDASKLISIDLSEIDETGDRHDDIVSQIFRFEDHTITIPIAEIDSVVFGNSNVVAIRNNVRKIMEEDIPYISDFDGHSITYTSASPSNIIPNEGEKIYYDGFCDRFPYGLCAKVTTKNATSNGYQLHISEIPPSDVFSEYVVSGDFEYRSDAATRADFNGGFSHDLDFEAGPVKLATEFKGTLSFRNFVGSPTRDYYSADIYLGHEIGLDINIHSDDSGSIELESPSVTLARGTIAGVLYPELDISLFSDLEAMLSIGMKMRRSPSIHFQWICENGRNTFRMIDDKQPAPNETDEATLDLLLEGTLHLGLKADLSLNTLFNRAGAGIRAKIGPEFKGEFGVGMLSKMAEEYNPEYFAKANITTAFVAKMDTYLYHLENIIMGDRVETQLPFSAECRFWERTHQLLPEFHTRAVRVNTVIDDASFCDQQKAIDIAAITEDNIIKDLEVGFQLNEKNSSEPLISEMDSNPVIADNNEAQGFNLSLPYSGMIDNIEARPIVKYADKTVLCAPVTPLEGAAINNIYYSGVGNTAYGVAGASIVGNKTTEGTTYIVGNIMPIAQSNPVFKKKKTFSLVSFIEEDGAPSGSHATIFGEWASDDGKIQLNIESKERESSFNGIPCSIALNTPQPGIITLTSSEGKNLIIRICEVTDATLSIAFKNSTAPVILNRIK